MMWRRSDAGRLQSAMYLRGKAWGLVRPCLTRNGLAEGCGSVLLVARPGGAGAMPGGEGRACEVAPGCHGEVRSMRWH